MAVDRVRRVDRIRAIVEKRGGRVRVREVREELCVEEDDPELSAGALYAAIRNENERLLALGQAALFRTRREGEAHGWISLVAAAPEEGRTGAAAKIAAEIRRANGAIDDTIREGLRRMDWRTFESKFLTVLLEKLGFQDVEVTQATRDGGVDARVNYRRGIVDAKAIVSAKHWTNGRVPVSEVRNVRGIKGNEDTAIIVTSGSFTAEAKQEAEPGQNQRVVYLIDGTRIVEACKQYGIGITRQPMPDLLVVDELFQAAEDDNEEDDQESADAPETQEADAETRHASEPRARRLREEMLGDAERGLSIEEIAKLTGRAPSTVGQYLYVPERRRSLFERLRGDAEIRERALQIIRKKRGDS
jgi:restriction endonuclease Mrr